MKAKHTQGPWKVITRKSNRFVREHRDIKVVGQLPVCYLSDNTHQAEGEAEANAKLIELAPEMLTLLKKLLDTKTLSERSAPELTYEAQDLITKIESV